MTAPRRPRRLRGDDGQVTTALLVLMVLTVLAVVLKALVPLAGATDQRSRAQTAADAAALGAVDRLGERVRDALKPGLALGFRGRALTPFATCPQAREAAQDYARRNGATLLDSEWGCRGRGAGTQVRAGVRTDDRLEGNQRSEALAHAEIGLGLDPCPLSEDPQVLKAAYDAAVAAAAAASASAGAAQEAAEKAQQAVEDALAEVEAGDLDPEVARQLIEDAERAAEQASDAAEEAVDNASGPAPDTEVTLTADCGGLGLRLTLDLPGLRLSFGRIDRGDLDDVLEPRLLSDREARV